jgi:hypothetical protein
MGLYIPRLNREGHWRLIWQINGSEMDLCGAVDYGVACEQCAILNTMRLHERLAH